MHGINRNRGFSLLELLVALSIATLLMTMGVPSFQSVLANQRLVAANNELVSSLNLARTEAIKRVRYVTICKSNNGTSCGAGGIAWEDGWIIFVNASSANPNQVNAGDEILRVYPAVPDGVTLRRIGTINSFLSFRPTGTAGTAAANLTGTLTFCDKRGAGSARAVRIQPSGQWSVSRELAHDGSALVCPQ